MLRSCLVCVVISCGGPTIRELPRKTTTCSDHWLTIDRDVIDLEVAAGNRVLWAEYEGSAIAAGPRDREGSETMEAGAANRYTTALAIAGDKVAWAREDDGSIWKLDGGKPTQIATIKKLTQLEATADAIVAASEDGIFRISWSGEQQEIFSGDVWVMALDRQVAYAQSGTKLVRVALDGKPPLTIAEDAPNLTSIVVHDGKVLATAKNRGVLVVEGDKLVPYAPLALPTLIWNLRSANGRVYFTADNVVYQVRDGKPVPIAIAHEMIGDLEIDGEAILTASRERTGVHGFCHAVDGPPVVLAPQDNAKRTCLDGESPAGRNHELSFECGNAEGDTVYSLGFHASGGVFEEITRDGIQRTFYADGKRRDERPRGKAGAEKHWYVNGEVKSEGLVDSAGAKDGTWHYYKPDRGIKDTIEWSHGKRVR